jgi:putative transposase
VYRALIDPGKLWQNGADETFNGKFRDERLSMNWFRSREAARVVPKSGGGIAMPRGRI